MHTINRYLINSPLPYENNRFSLQLAYGYRILSFGTRSINPVDSFPYTEAYVDILEPTNKEKCDVKFIVAEVGSTISSLTYRACLGSFIAPNGKQCYVFEGGMVGV